LDVYHTSTHRVALVRIYNAGLKPAARGSLKTRATVNCVIGCPVWLWNTCMDGAW